MNRLDESGTETTEPVEETDSDSVSDQTLPAEETDSIPEQTLPAEGDVDGRPVDVQIESNQF